MLVNWYSNLKTQVSLVSCRRHRYGKNIIDELSGAWVSGEPSYGFLPHKGVLSPAEHVLYISYSNGAGPYDGTNGTVHKYNITSGVWTDISPTPVSTT
jgi:hypothetical protein